MRACVRVHACMHVCMCMYVLKLNTQQQCYGMVVSHSPVSSVCADNDTHRAQIASFPGLPAVQF